MLRKRLDERDPIEREGGPKADDVCEATLEDLYHKLREKSPNGYRIEQFDETALMKNIHLVNAYYDKNLPGDIESGQRVLGPAYSFMKRIVRKVTSWYVVPAQENQRLFNAYVTRCLNEMKRYLDDLQINEDVQSTIMHRDLALFRSNIIFMNRYLERRMLAFENQLGLVWTPGAAGRVPARVTAGDNGSDYLDTLQATLDVLTLEQRVHGSPILVKDRQRVYLQYFRECKNVLAFGCGRGEMLQLLTEAGIPARGTETNPALVGYCRDQGLDVSQVDPLEYLETQDDGLLDGIMLSRFAGHHQPARLVRVLQLCRQKLADEGILVIETPNPFSLYAVTSYALEDSTRIHPLHPETLKLLCLSCGFLEPEVLFLNSLPPEENLEELEISSTMAILDPREQELFTKINQNFRKINRSLFSHRDYALVTRRGSRYDS